MNLSYAQLLVPARLPVCSWLLQVPLLLLTMLRYPVKPCRILRIGCRLENCAKVWKKANEQLRNGWQAPIIYKNN